MAILGHTGMSVAEFALVLPGMTPDALTHKLRRLNAITANLDSPIPVSFRIGRAFYPEDGDSDGVLLEVARFRASGAPPEETAPQLDSLREALQENLEALQENVKDERRVEQRMS